MNTTTVQTTKQKIRTLFVTCCCMRALVDAARAACTTGFTTGGLCVHIQVSIFVVTNNRYTYLMLVLRPYRRCSSSSTAAGD
jgi:hypothetical protein